MGVADIDKALPETCQSTDQTGNEDGASATKPVIEGRGEPAAHKGAADVGRRIDQTDEPGSTLR